ncbi:hypothetical protein [Rhodococcus sp. 14-2483-1-2]|uniref:hypothetical protein n=1 Tax=Rhodococcus sp. 14-2483-1-2 TaxID=2023147 RepID=UPI000B9AAE8A|nr:hypothetical protein [Rhodococcus sp. 14-2483-1-2]OZF26215.1 hypothetical protein CH295_26795 [Rhodococcus sp. 14-2483-1-2]
MSARKRRAAFDPNALDDLDDLLPPLNLVRDAAAAGSNSQGSSVDVLKPAQAKSAQADSNGDAEGNEGAPAELAAGGAQDQATSNELGELDRSQLPTDTPNEPASHGESTQTDSARTEAGSKQTASRRADARRKTTKRDASTNTNRVAPPEVALPEEIYSALRSLTLSERGANPATARSYGQVVLDAVEHHADDLKAYWSRSAPVPNTGLFRRAEVGRPTRRRHSAPRARVPLAGVIDTDAAVLDQLATDWGAGSRSALVEQALRLYLEVD